MRLAFPCQNIILHPDLPTFFSKPYKEVRAIREGGGNGSIIGRNSFQRRKEEAVAFLRTLMKIYAGELD